MKTFMRLFEAIIRVFEQGDFKSLNIVTGGLAFLLICNIYALAHLGLDYFALGFSYSDPTIIIPCIFVGLFSFWALQKRFDGTSGFFICSGLTLFIFYFTALSIHGVYLAIMGLVGLI